MSQELMMAVTKVEAAHFDYRKKTEELFDMAEKVIGAKVKYWSREYLLLYIKDNFSVDGVKK